ncbi:hypothetical protein Y032_0048g1576 [Ancylostoma ceylanicum]|uniref:SCP domain-containing protein n=1 Tax=Ancylostoma ceylanicum TaxID=53326 RepID=A0A016UA87_9BILA|nr:hypothetical protein Y032_0048g1576 [Ancylostoma ceylanicum]
MPKAEDMVELTWDCDIENNAFLSTCDQTTVPIPTDYASNSATLSMTGKKCDIKENTMAVLNSWYDQVKAEDHQNDAKYNDQTQKEFGIVSVHLTVNLKANPLPDCPNPQAGQLGDDKMTYDMQITARDMANYYRNLVATGWAQDKNGYAPTAKGMNALAMSKWYDQLKNVDLDEDAKYDGNVQTSAKDFANVSIV